jgi:hypothetical protein
MQVIYSFVIDGAQKYQDQARIFLFSLLATGVNPRNVHAQLTPAAQTNVNLLDFLKALGVHVHNLASFLDGVYCNKLMQLDSLSTYGAECVALCDTDLAFLNNLDGQASSHVVRAKPVEIPNPPIDYLEKARAICGVAGNPRVVPTSCNDGQTWTQNCNGGVYLIPTLFAAKIAASWRRHATTLYSAKFFLHNYAQHIDQISFATTMLDLQIDVEELPLEFNFPLHFADQFSVTKKVDPEVLHYHWLHHGAESLQLTGHPIN